MSMVLQLLLLKLFLLLPALKLAVAKSDAWPGCPDKCGNVSIPYPFGIGEGCYLSDGFSVICDKEDIPFQGTSKSDNSIEILNISLGDGELLVKGGYSSLCYDSEGNQTKSFGFLTDLKETPFRFSVKRNKFFTIGCNTIGSLIFRQSKDQEFTSSCLSLCTDNSKIKNDTCSGNGCCKISIPEDIKEFVAMLLSVDNHTAVNSFNPCRFAFLADDNLFSFQVSDLSPTDGIIRRTNIPVAWDWAIGDQTCPQVQLDAQSYACKQNTVCLNSTNGPGYQCACKQGYRGNPYLGCHDYDECKEENSCVTSAKCEDKEGYYNCICPPGYHGDGKKGGNGCTPDTKVVRDLKWVIGGIGIGVSSLVLFIGAFWFNRVLQERKLRKMREQLSQQNGDLLLELQIASRRGASSDVAKIFTVKELEKVPQADIRTTARRTT